jgi:GNAT superfamily N-acetyltransferase
VPDHSIFVRHAGLDDAAILASHQSLSEQEATQYRGATTRNANDWSIDSVFVESASRDIGIGDALVLACISELRELNATWLQSSALPGDRAMKNLFERHGLVAQTIIVGKKL